jgi:PIN domain nuclease of toxin-antitoxin system
MRLLLDTHAFLWAFDKPQALSRSVRELLEDGAVERWVSVIALAEIAVKVQKGLLDMPLTRDFHLAQLAAMNARLLRWRANTASSSSHSPVIMATPSTAC